MLEEARISFYDITRCGYYAGHKKLAEYGHLNETLMAVRDWSAKLQLGETCTYKVKEGDTFHHTYCFKMVRLKTGSTLLTLWNEMPSAEGNVASVSADAPVGAAAVSLTEVPKNNIPGYATYFWILPDRQLLATVMFQHQLNGHSALRKFLWGFLSRFGPHVVQDENDEDMTDAFDQAILGYRKDKASPLQHMTPSFRSSPVRHAGQIDLIRSRQPQIRKIIRKEALHPKRVEEASFLKQMLAFTGINEPHTHPIEYRVKYEIDHAPTSDELDNIITAWESQDESEWDDVGFVFTGENSTRWLSHSVERHVMNLNITRENSEIVEPASLLKALEGQREFLLKNIPKNTLSEQ